MWCVNHSCTKYSLVFCQEKSFVVFQRNFSESLVGPCTPGGFCSLMWSTKARLRNTLTKHLLSVQTHPLRRIWPKRQAQHRLLAMTNAWAWNSSYLRFKQLFEAFGRFLLHYMSYDDTLCKFWLLFHINIVVVCSGWVHTASSRCLFDLPVDRIDSCESSELRRGDKPHWFKSRHMICMGRHVWYVVWFSGVAQVVLSYGYWCIDIALEVEGEHADWGKSEARRPRAFGNQRSIGDPSSYNISTATGTRTS